jgi:hypothetical protein
VGADRLAGLLAVALLTASGWGLCELAPALRGLPAARRFGYAFLAGIAWVAGGLYALSHFFSVPLRTPAILVLILLPVAGGLVARWRSPLGPKPGKERGAIAVIGLLVGWIALGLFAEAVSEPIADFDGRMTWGATARYLWAEETVDARTLQRPQWAVSHPRYPLLMPVAQVITLELTGAGEDQYPFRPLYAAFYLAFLAVLWDGCRRRAGVSASALTVLAAAAVPFLSLQREGGALGAYSDLPLACFYGAGLALLAGWELRRADLLLGGGFLGAAVLTKNEGLPLALAGLIFAALSKRKESWLAALPVLAALALLFSWQASIPNRFDEGYGHLVRQASPGAALSRLAAVAPVVLRQTFAVESWGLLWVALPVIWFAGRRGWTARSALPLLLAAAVPLAAALVAYAVHPRPVGLAEVTWNRLLVQGLMPVLWLTALSWEGLWDFSRDA